MISSETLQFVRSLLDRTSVQLGAPDARELTASVFRAQEEIDMELLERAAGT